MSCEDVFRKYEVFYRKDSTFQEDRHLTTSDVLLSVKFARLGVMYAVSTDSAYRKLQGEKWSPNGEARPLIEALGLSHTSMSVGDVLHDLETGQMFQCAPCGWTAIPESIGGTEE